MQNNIKREMRMVGADLKGDRPSNDFYETPQIAVEKLLKKEVFSGTIWDPAVGNGAILRELENHFSKMLLYGSDIRKDNMVFGDKGIDFLKVTKNDFMDNIIVNPPFRESLGFAIHSLKMAKKKVALFTKIQFLEGKRRRNELFVHNPPNRIWVFVDRLSCPDGITVSDNGGMLCFAWYVWEKGITQVPYQPFPVLGWID